MEINSKGFKMSTLQEYLDKWTDYLKTKYGQDFSIKPEGVIDNLVVGFIMSILEVEAQIGYLLKNINPYTAEAEWQDKLYKLIGLNDREQASHTVVQRTVQGTPNTVADAGSVLFKNDLTNDQFRLIDDCQLDSTGIGTGSFRAEEAGAIDLPENAKCVLIAAPTNVLGIYFTSGNSIDIGQEYQEDSEYREIWLAEQSLIKAKTEGGLKKSLLPYCFNNINNIKIRMNRNTQTYNDVPLHSANIVVNSPYDDETIAKVIGDKVLDGLGLVGNIQQEYTDSEGEKEDIFFDRATKVNISYQIVVVLKSGFILEQVKSAVISAVKTANENRVMGEDIIANKVIADIDKIDGIDYVKSIKVSTDKATWQDVIDIADTSIGQVDEVNVSI